MSILDRLLGLSTEEDLTETSWWTDTIFRGLELAGSAEDLAGSEGSAPPDGGGELGRS